MNIHWQYWCWTWNSNTLATWCKELTHWKDPDAGKDWRWEEKGTTGDEMVGWHHLLHGHEFWVSSRSWWWTGKPGVLQFPSMELQRVRHDWATELNWTEITYQEKESTCAAIYKCVYLFSWSYVYVYINTYRINHICYWEVVRNNNLKWL